jgi:tetrahydromethanopterin S-methyltransferase subunit E
MTNESSPSDMRNVWQNQKPEGIRMSVEEIRGKAARFQRKVFWENALNYVVLLAGVAFVSFCLVWHRFPTTVLIRLGLGLTVAALLYMLWQTHKRSPSRRVPAEMGIVSCLDFYRKELERRRDLHRSVWQWCFGPAIPGVIILLVVMARIHTSHVRHPGWILIGVLTVSVLMVVYGWRQSAARARKLQSEIDEIDAFQGRR